jgi:hypothetical protein
MQASASLSVKAIRMGRFRRICGYAKVPYGCIPVGNPRWPSDTREMRIHSRRDGALEIAIRRPGVPAVRINVCAEFRTAHKKHRSPLDEMCDLQDDRRKQREDPENEQPADGRTADSSTCSHRPRRRCSRRTQVHTSVKFCVRGSRIEKIEGDETCHLFSSGGRNIRISYDTWMCLTQTYQKARDSSPDSPSKTRQFSQIHPKGERRTLQLSLELFY